MATISSILAASPTRDDADAAIYAALGLTSPGAVAHRDMDGRLMVWASGADSVDDDGSRAAHRTRAPITDSEWAYVCGMAWIADYESA